MRPNDPAYSRYARHYDKIGQRRFGEHSATDLLRILELQGDRPKSVLDLACGTGAATIVFARSGLETAGLDIAQAMLDEAAAAARSADVSVHWILADMTAYVAARGYDLCTCFYDAVNYLADLREFGAFARCAFNALDPGGTLAFDINTRRKLAEHWGQMTLIAANDRDRFLTYRSWFDERHGVSPLIITGFERRDDGAWDRFDEEHVETAFTIDDLQSRLESVGFEQIQVIDWREGDITDLVPGTEDAFRVLFMGRKPALAREES
jgi:SAM-dependent methyltransferase